MKIIGVITEKGGVGKSHITFNLGWALAEERGKRVLLIDLDPQRANLTALAGMDKKSIDCTMFHVLTQRQSIKKAIVTVEGNLHIVQADASVAKISPENSTLNGLRMAMNEIRQYYDYVFIDVPPSPGQSHMLTAGVADYAIIPLESKNILSLDAAMGISKTLLEAKRTVNPNLNILGILMNKYSWRTLLSRQILNAAEQIADGLDTVVLDSKIRDNVSIAEAVGRHEGITRYAPKSNGAIDFLKLVDELEERMKK